MATSEGSNGGVEEIRGIHDALMCIHLDVRKTMHICSSRSSSETGTVTTNYHRIPMFPPLILQLDACKGKDTDALHRDISRMLSMIHGHGPWGDIIKDKEMVFYIGASLSSSVEAEATVLFVLPLYADKSLPAYPVSTYCMELVLRGGYSGRIPALCAD
ncbi:hypothetical protein ACLOJK_012832 [Asimina triloba]